MAVSPERGTPEVKWQEQPHAHVSVEDVHRILVGRRPSDILQMFQEGVAGAPVPKGGHATGSNLIWLFPLHPSVSQDNAALMVLWSR